MECGGSTPPLRRKIHPAEQRLEELSTTVRARTFYLGR
jgi:hypothetical protein